MNGIHDMGGMDNMGALKYSATEEKFHADWERVMFANAIAVLGAGYCKLDEVRRTTEWMPAADYLRAPYYATWLHAVCAILLEKRLVTEEELTHGRSDGGRGVLPPLTKDMIVYAMNNPIPLSLDLQIPLRFKPGDSVIARNINTTRHTRLPRYARGKRGTIECDHGVFLLPDRNAHEGPALPQHVYGVRFAAEELWGDEVAARDAVYIDLFDEYLEAECT